MLLAAQFAFGMACEQLWMVLLSAAHFKAAVRLGGCYPAHIFCRSGAAGVGIRGTVFYRLYCYRRHSLPGSSFIQVVILHTIPGSRRWNPPHSLRRAGLLSAAQFRCGVHRGAKKNGCYRAHNSDFFLRAAGCYPQHNLRGG